MSETPKLAYNLPSNSKKSKEESPKSEEREKQEQVTSGKVVQRKTPLTRKIAETFTGSDARGLGEYIFIDVIVPATKDLIVDVFIQGIQRAIYGDARRPTRSSNASGPTNYSKIYSNKPQNQGSNPNRRELSSVSRARHDFDEIILETRTEAEEVIERLMDLVAQYGVATVADLYDLVGVTSSFTDNKYGWTNLHGSTHRRVREGYLLELPRPGELD